MQKTTFFLFFLPFASLFAQSTAQNAAENLVPNPSFEINEGGYATEARDEAKNRRLFEASMSDWKAATLNSPDIRNLKKPQKGERFELPPHSGSSYSGAVCSSMNAEVISAKLKRTVKAGEAIYVEFWYAFGSLQGLPSSPKNNNKFFGALLTEKEIRVQNCHATVSEEQVHFPSDLSIIKLKWTKLSRTIVAKTDLNYINIGFFIPESTGTFDDYYYIDDVLVQPAKIEDVTKLADLPKKDTIKPIVAKPKKTIETAEKGESFVVENIQFETAKATLLPVSFQELDKIVDALRKNLNLKIEIQGHTDNTGNAAANQRLSENRALAVQQYLIQKGISAERLQPKGYGDTQPIAPNDTAQGRAQNRRVACKVN
jgi:outer membrane protein OmpA-like peptidoglycan-associated protein